MQKIGSYPCQDTQTKDTFSTEVLLRKAFFCLPFGAYKCFRTYKYLYLKYLNLKLFSLPTDRTYQKNSENVQEHILSLRQSHTHKQDIFQAQFN